MAYKQPSSGPFKMMGSSPVKRKVWPPTKGGFDIDKHLDKKPVDPDAPGTPGKPGYEPPVRREDLDTKGKALWDHKHKAEMKEASKKKNTITVKKGGGGPTPPTKPKTKEEIDAFRAAQLETKGSDERETEKINK